MLRSATLVNGLALAVIISFLVFNGWRAIGWSFLTEPPYDSMTRGGILPCIVGTLILSLGAMAVALPLGTASAVYLHEYARPGATVRIIKFGVNNLAGVPSIVFGLFGLAFFVTWLKLGVSILSGVMTLGALILPIVIGTAEEALASVPASYREASLALGASRLQTVSRVVLPAALPGILTGAILGVSRAAGETAAIMFTAARLFHSAPSDVAFRSGNGSTLPYLCARHGGDPNRLDPAHSVRNGPDIDNLGAGDEPGGNIIPGKDPQADVRLSGNTYPNLPVM